MGGPALLTWNAIAELACAAAHQPARIRHVPLVRAAISAVRPLAARRAEIASFVCTAMTHDLVAPPIVSTS